MDTLTKTPTDYIILNGLGHQLSDDEFLLLCSRNRDLRLERDHLGNIVVMPPAGSESGHFEIELAGELRDWNKKHNAGIVFGPSAGFTLPDNSVRSPDAAYVPREDFKKVPPELRQKFAPVVPLFAAEVASPSDSLDELRQKMEEVWMKNGVALAWLIDPKGEQAWIYRVNGEVEHVQGLDKELDGEDVLPGFRLPLSLFRPL